MSKKKVPLTLDQVLEILNKKRTSPFTKKVRTGDILAIPLDKHHYAFAKVVWIPSKNRGTEMLLCVYDYFSKEIADTGYLKRKYIYYFNSLTKYVLQNNQASWKVVNTMQFTENDLLPLANRDRRTNRVYVGNIYLRPALFPDDDVITTTNATCLYDYHVHEDLSDFFLKGKIRDTLLFSRLSRNKKKMLRRLFLND